MKMSLQQQWDYWLVAMFLTKPYMDIWKAANWFRAKTNPSHEEFSKLKRLPKTPHIQCSVQRFICGYIPGGGNFIFDATKETAFAISARISRCGDSTTQPVDAFRQRKEGREISSSGRAAQAARTQRDIDRDIRYRSSRSAWNVCK